MNSLDAHLQKQLEERKRLQRYRQRITLTSPQKSKVCITDQTFLNFCSNDYLGLANHPQLKESMLKAAQDYGVGSGASHLVCGHSEEHHALEIELAEFTGRDRALLFSTGYMANMGVIAALAGRSDEVFQDKLNHASLIDGAMLSRASLTRYRHTDVAHLKSCLQKSEAKNKLVVTDSVFSMDGNLAPLAEIAECAKDENAWLMVDDAHGFGVLGERGAGSAEYLSLDQNSLPILIGTFGKAVGTFGAFVAGSGTLIESLIQFARTYIYTTAIPPAIAATTRSSLTLLQSESWRREKLKDNIAYFRDLCVENALNLMPSHSPIQPILIGSDKDALAVSSFLKTAGILVSAIRPPTVPEGTARLRITLSASHERADIEKLVLVLVQALTDLKKS